MSLFNGNIPMQTGGNVDGVPARFELGSNLEDFSFVFSAVRNRAPGSEKAFLLNELLSFAKAGRWGWFRRSLGGCFGFRIGCAHPGRLKSRNQLSVPFAPPASLLRRGYPHLRFPRSKRGVARLLVVGGELVPGFRLRAPLAP